MKKILSQSAGFTLIELLVSLAIFSIVIIGAIGSLYTVNQASVKVNAMRTVLDNLNFSTESMSRTIRTGQNIVCGGVGPRIGGTNCAFGGPAGTAIALDSTIGGNKSIVYQFVQDPTNNNNGMIEKCNINGTSLSGTVDQSSCISITAPEINVQEMSFFVDGADSGDGKQPSVMIRMQGIASAGINNIAPFAVQTYISQRAGE